MKIWLESHFISVYLKKTIQYERRSHLTGFSIMCWLKCAKIVLSDYANRVIRKSIRYHRWYCNFRHILFFAYIILSKAFTSVVVDIKNNPHFFNIFMKVFRNFIWVNRLIFLLDVEIYQFCCICVRFKVRKMKFTDRNWHEVHSIDVCNKI